MSSPKKRKALVLEFPGAPSTFHTVEGVPGYLHPNFGRVIGEGPGELDAKFANELAKSIDLVRVVDISEAEAADALDAHALNLRQARSSTAAAVELATAPESRARVREEVQQLQKADAS